MQRMKKTFALYLALVIVVGLSTTAAYASPPADPWKSPQQIAATMTENPCNEVVVTWTTIDTTLTDAKVEVTPASGGASSTFTATKTNRNVTTSSQRTESGDAVTQKAFYVAYISGLTADTAYNYVCSAVDADGTVYASAGAAFKTALADDDGFTFIYLSDTQASGVNGKAMTASSTLWAEYDPSFVYIAGDLTDTATNEGQWEIFFNQKTPGMDNAVQFSDNYDSAISNYVIAAVQGNHDNNVFSDHLNYSASGGTNITYAYTYGCAHFIMLNFENTATRAAQQEFLRDQVAYAKASGLWTIVGFHKSIYSGASHMTDADVVDARMYWSPIFADLDVDIVLQGHDHVLSRGIIDAAGNNAGNPVEIAERTYTAAKTDNAPLYYVGNCASTLKFYAASAGYASNTTLAAPDYGFLDINSAREVGHAQNPDGPQTGDFDPLPTFTSVTVTKDAITFETYMFRYDIGENTISSEPFLFDSFTMTREESGGTELVEATAEAFVVKQNGNTNELTITITELYSDGSTNVIVTTVQISNNAAGAYEVGEYMVYVDTKGNDQIRACYIVE
ncbi:MAG: metallophosphoesterase [Oscillospiraceae bacterium]|nr:metallophosphoesterase [Oscillospiraceae bacterium]